MTEEFEVGYRKPPRKTQFKPGKSGNAKGRPKGSKGFSTYMQQELRERIHIKENGKPKSISKAQAIAKQLVNKAVTGDSRATPIPAFEIEQRVIQTVRSALGDQSKLALLLEAANVEPQHLMLYLHEAQTLVKRLDIEVDHFDLILPLLERVELKQDCLQLTLKLVAETAPAAMITADLPMQIKRRGVEMRVVVGDCKAKPDLNLLKAVARARLWFDELATGKTASVADIVKREGLDQGYVSRLLKLAFLPPKVVESIVAGTQPVGWTVRTLMAGNTD